MYDAIRALATSKLDSNTIDNTIETIKKQVDSMTTYGDGYNDILRYISRTDDKVDTVKILYKYIPTDEGGKISTLNIENVYLTKVLTQLQGGYYTESSNTEAYKLVKDMLELQMKEWGINVVE